MYSKHEGNFSIACLVFEISWTKTASPPSGVDKVGTDGRRHIRKDTVRSFLQAHLLTDGFKYKIILSYNS